MARSRGADAIMALAFESTYGAAPAATGYFQAPFKSHSLGAERKLITDDLLGNGRNRFDPVLDTIENSGDVAIPVDVRNLGLWLKLLLGAPTTAAALAAAVVYTFTAQPAAASTLTLNGTVWTFVATGATGQQSNIGVSLAATLTALATALNASGDTQVTKCTYVATATTLTATYKTLGPAGNAFTVAASAPSNATPASATLLGGANTHTFLSGAQNLPSASIEVGLPDVPSFGMNTGMRANMLKLTAATSGLLGAVVSLMGQNEALATSSGAGTPTVLATDRFTNFSGQVTRNGVQLAGVTSAGLTLNNNLEAIDVIRPDGANEDYDPGVAELLLSLVTRFADTIMVNQASSGLPCAIGLNWSRNAGQALSVTVHRAFLPVPKRPITGPQGIQVSYDIQAAIDTTLNKMFTVVLTNDVTSY